jgi:tRNA 2-thiocytidine biosynthesis protein TtcA
MRQSIFKKITRLTGKAIGDFKLIEEGDRVLVALSGGKDSWSLLYALLDLQRKAPIEYEIAAVTIVPGSDTHVAAQLEDRLTRDGIPHHVIGSSISDIIDSHLTKGTNPCSFCSRLRRGILYTYAIENGWNKIALGHHLDDFVETLLLNIFFNATIKGMSPNLIADDGRNKIIRPLVYVKEQITRECAEFLAVPILGCMCPAGRQNQSKRGWVKSLISEIEKDVPDVKTNLIAAMGRVQHRHLLTSGAGGMNKRR